MIEKIEKILNDKIEKAENSKLYGTVTLSLTFQKGRILRLNATVNEYFLSDTVAKKNVH